VSDWDYPFQNSYILNEEQWEEWESNIHGVPDGVKRGIYGEFEVTPASSGLVVNVAGGVAVVRGFYTRRESEKPLALQPPDTTNPRIDLVVLRRSKSGGGFTRMVITGDATASPVAPAPVRDNDNWDLPLAEVYVAANAQSLDAGDITDLRVWTSGLDEHLDDTNNPHGVSYDQVGAAAAEHTHPPSDLETSGAQIFDALLFDGGAWVPGAGAGMVLVYTVTIGADVAEVVMDIPQGRDVIAYYVYAYTQTDYTGNSRDLMNAKLVGADGTVAGEDVNWAERYLSATSSGVTTGTNTGMNYPRVYCGANNNWGISTMLIAARNPLRVSAEGQIGTNAIGWRSATYVVSAVLPLSQIVLIPQTGTVFKAGSVFALYLVIK